MPRLQINLTALVSSLIILLNCEGFIDDSTVFERIDYYLMKVNKPNEKRWLSFFKWSGE